eukprot:5684145-Pyramimonas_sp.AAC.1
MAAGRAAGGCSPSVHYPCYRGDELQGYWIHQTAIRWMSRDDNERRTWHFAFSDDYEHYFRRSQGKGYSKSKNKNKDKHDRPAPYAGRGKGGRSASPYWAADQTG